MNKSPSIPKTLQRHSGATVMKALLAIIPPLLAFLANSSLHPARFHAVLKNIGVLGWSIYAVIYVWSFGVIIVISSWAARRCGVARAFWFSIVSSAIVVLGAHDTMLDDMVNTAGWRSGTGLDHWTVFLVRPDPFVLIVALCIGWCASWIPKLLHGESSWLSGGMCPKCHYDLQGKTDAGCPECGWNRPIAPSDSAATKSQSDGS